MSFCTGVGRKNVLSVEELRVRGSWHGTLANKFIMTVTTNNSYNYYRTLSLKEVLPKKGRNKTDNYKHLLKF